MSENYKYDLDQVMNDALVQVKQVAGEYIEGLRAQLAELDQTLVSERRKPSNRTAEIDLEQVYTALQPVYPDLEKKLLPVAVVNRVKRVEGDLRYRDQQVKDIARIISDCGFADRHNVVTQVRNLVEAYEQLRSRHDELQAKLLRVQDLASDITEETQR